MADGSDGLTTACCDPSAAFDTHGNLFLTYIGSSLKTIQVLQSTNGGKTFSNIATIRGNIDQPTITAGPNSVWLTFQNKGKITATGAPISASGQVGAFSPLQIAPGPNGANFG